MMRGTVMAIGLAACLLPGAVPAQDRTELERTPIVGNRELPKVLYIVPWKKPPPTRLNGRVDHGVLDAAAQPLEREVLRRQLHYDTQWRERQAAAPQGDVR